MNFTNGGVSMEFGDRLRRLRSVQGLSVRELARRVGVSGSYISQLEGKECHPSFSVLKKISSVLETTTSVLIEDDFPEEWVVVRAAARRRLSTSDPKQEVDFMAFTGSRDKSMQPCLVRLKPGANGASQVFTHDREDVIYVIQGSLTVISGPNEYTLRQGDTAYFGFNRPEAFKNPGPDEAAFLWVVSPSR
jgi:transcriptional regulator with XRE-family HTH domain